MPMYDYICPDCSDSITISKPMKVSDRDEYCHCGALLKRSYLSELCNVGVIEYAKPHVSDSLAMHPEQVPEHRKKFPDIEVLPDGRPVLRDTSQHNKYLKRIGWYKAPSKRRK